jgi:outer membrane protein OmpA-like peptidoglycan-associated protein
VKANKGCPEIKREVRQLLQKAMQGIEFETNKSNIKPKSFPLMDKIAKIFIENSNYIIEVQGHTDNVGTAEYNLKLSDARANSVMKYLVEHGVPAERMTAHGYGLTQPIADNKTKAGRQKNRRVEFKISFEEVHYETILDHADPAPADSTNTVTPAPAEATQPAQ